MKAKSFLNRATNQRTKSMKTTTLKHGLSALMISALLLPGADAGKGGNKGGGGNNTGDVGGDVSGTIFSQLVLDDGIGNYLESDELGPYLDGVDMAEIRVGRNRHMRFDLNTHNKKASIRKLNLWSNLPAVVDTDGFVYDAASIVNSGLPCEPQLSSQELLGASLDPDLASNQWNLLADAELGIAGEDHDDAEVGCIRYLGARIFFTDNSGEQWYLSYGRHPNGSGSILSPCADSMLVTRLPNLDDDGDPTTPGLAQWHITTEGSGLAYLYHNPPNQPLAFHSIVQLPLSGVVTSLSQEEEPDPTNPDTHCMDSDAPLNPAPIEVAP